MTRSIESTWIDTSRELWALQGEALIEVLPGTPTDEPLTLSVKYKVSHLTGADRLTMDAAARLEKPTQTDLHRAASEVSRQLALNNIGSDFSTRTSTHVWPADFPMWLADSGPVSSQSLIPNYLQTSLIHPIVDELIASAANERFTGHSAQAESFIVRLIRSNLENSINSIPIPVLQSPPSEIRSWTSWISSVITGSASSVTVATAVDQPVVIVAAGSGMAFVMWLTWPAIENLRTKIDQWSSEKLQIQPNPRDSKKKRKK